MRTPREVAADVWDVARRQIAGIPFATSAEVVSVLATAIEGARADGMAVGMAVEPGTDGVRECIEAEEGVRRMGIEPRELARALKAFRR